jgi:hypothetical protein
MKARYQALTNAEEFIRRHGDEGGIDEDTFDFPEELYHREKLKVAKMLGKLADKLKEKYKL